jgi:prepilin-type N-terminal cleavage/methylation domain-containing protein/prepilin-type processing-associated H-X9-DG protein
MPSHRPADRRAAFTLIELLVVVSIIALLISILLPSLSRARDQSKGVHCNARLHDFAVGFASYENINYDMLPPALWTITTCPTHQKPVRAGWEETLYPMIYREPVYPNEDTHPDDFAVQRNLHPDRYAGYFLCKASGMRGTSAGHYRVYLPFWAYGTWSVYSDSAKRGQFNLQSGPDPSVSVTRGALSPKMVLLGDSNELSYRGDGDAGSSGSSGSHEGDDSTFIGPSEANEAGPGGQDGNRFSDRHYGGTNFLYQDFHAEWEPKLREKIARDFDMNGIIDVEEGG